jgi:hypothetical protein
MPEHLFFKEAMMPQANTPDLDVAPAGTIQQGWTCSYSCWYTEDVEAGDLISRNKMRLLL